MTPDQQRVVEDNRPLAMWMIGPKGPRPIRKYAVQYRRPEDALGQAELSLVEAVEQHDQGKGKLATILYWRLRRNIQHGLLLDQGLRQRKIYRRRSRYEHSLPSYTYRSNDGGAGQRDMEDAAELSLFRDTLARMSDEDRESLALFARAPKSSAALCRFAKKEGVPGAGLERRLAHAVLAFRKAHRRGRREEAVA